MTKEKAYEMVLNDILNSGCEMFVGNYDAKHGGEQFMYGIGTVIEYIAYNVSDETGYVIEDLFTKNMVASEEKAKGIKCHRCAELSGCWTGQHGGKKNCKCFSPKGVDK